MTSNFRHWRAHRQAESTSCRTLAFTQLMHTLCAQSALCARWLFRVTT